MQLDPMVVDMIDIVFVAGVVDSSPVLGSEVLRPPLTMIKDLVDIALVPWLSRQFQTSSFS
jgi:hypothetical protein